MEIDGRLFEREGADNFRAYRDKKDKSEEVARIPEGLNSPQDARSAVEQVIAGTETTISSLVHGRDPERIQGRNLDLIGTHIPGFYLLVGTGENVPNMLRSEVDDLATDVRIYYLRDQVIKRLQILQEPLHDRLVDGGINIPGLRGGHDVNLGGEIQLNPNIEIDPSLIEKSLGDKSQEFIHSKTIFSVELDPDVDNVEEIHDAIRVVLETHGIDPNKISRNNTLRVDRDELLKAERKGEIVLIPGSIKVSGDLKDWRVRPRTVTTLREVEEAVKRAAESLGLSNPQIDTPKE